MLISAAVRATTLMVLIMHAFGIQNTLPLIRIIHRGGDHYEGPHWSRDESALYWVDIFKQEVLRLDYETKNITTKKIDYGPVSLVVTVKGNPKLLLVSSRSELYFMEWDNPGSTDVVSLRQISAVDVGLPDNRCNDGKVDAKGRLWFGTMGKEENGEVDGDQGTLYLMDQHNFAQPQVKIRPVSISNGIAWTSDNKFMFYIDTPTKNIDVFDFELESGTIRNRRTLFSFKSNNITGWPDGMTIDTDDNLWVACFNGGKVVKIDSRAGKLLEQHNIPKAMKVTSVVWGGYDLSTLYVTTSRVGLNSAELSEQTEAGSLFAIEGTGSKGYPEHQYIFPNAAFY